MGPSLGVLFMVIFFILIRFLTSFKKALKMIFEPALSTEERNKEPAQQT